MNVNALFWLLHTLARSQYAAYQQSEASDVPRFGLLMKMDECVGRVSLGLGGLASRTQRKSKLAPKADTISSSF